MTTSMTRRLAAGALLIGITATSLAGCGSSSGTHQSVRVGSAQAVAPPAALLANLQGAPTAEKVTGIPVISNNVAHAVVVQMTWATFAQESNILNGGHMTSGARPPNQSVYVEAAIGRFTVGEQATPRSLLIVCRSTTAPYAPLAISGQSGTTVPSWITTLPVLSSVG